MKAASSGGIAIRYREDGRPGAPAMVFANSLGTDLQVWDAVAAVFAGRFRVLRYDKRGHGLSDAPAGPYSLDDHVGDLAAVLDAAGIRDAVVVGVSVGGMIAQALSAARPDLVRALVLSNTAHRIGPPDMWERRIAAVRAGGIAPLADAILERWFSPAFRAAGDLAVAPWRNMLVRTPAEGYAGTCAAIRDADLAAVAAAIAVPTLAVAGSHDAATPPDLVRSTADLIPGAGFVSLPGLGHLPCVEDPGAVARVVDAFLKEQHLG